MMNVYGQLDAFYKEHKKTAQLLPRETAEKFLRRCAWRGAGDDELKLQWELMADALLYMEQVPLYAFLSLTPYDYQEIVYRLSADKHLFPADEAHVMQFFSLLERFYAYLAQIGYEDAREGLDEAKESFYEGTRFVLPERRPQGDFYSSLEHLDEISPEDMETLNGILDVLLRKIGEYFRRPQFVFDLTRAVTLFGGPNIMAPQEGEITAEQEAFWFSFWDYFLFDYHLLTTDELPLKYYYDHERAKLEPTEADIVRDLLKARLTIFYIESVEDDYIFCRDLFTDEAIELPVPDSFVPDYQRVILYGHIHARGVMLLNYITSVPASGKLRRRIKDEILYQYELFKYQQPDASLADFFARQAASVRHVIHILTEFAQLRVLPMKNYPKPLPASDAPEGYAAAETRLGNAARKLGFSAYAVRLLLKLYEDFLSVSPASTAKMRRASTLTAVLYVFAKINGVEATDLKTIVNFFHAGHDEIFRMVSDIQDRLKCILFDPRYITEEGSVQSLYME